MKIHPLAEMFPLNPEGREFNELAESIHNEGLREAIVLDGDMLVDGRNRLAACKAANVEPHYVQWKDITKPDDDLTEWIMARNMHRRHLTEEQKAAVWTEFFRLDAELRAAKAKSDSAKNLIPAAYQKTKDSSVTLKTGEPRKRDVSAEKARSTVGQIAAAAGISHHKAAQAVKLSKAAETSPEAKKALEDVKAGKTKLKDAVKIAEPVTIEAEVVVGKQDPAKPKRSADDIVTIICDLLHDLRKLPEAGQLSPEVARHMLIYLSGITMPELGCLDEEELMNAGVSRTLAHAREIKKEAARLVKEASK